MRTFTATLAIALGLSLCAIAAAPVSASYDAVPSAQQSGPVPERVAGAQQQDQQPLPERVFGGQQRAAVPEQQAVVPESPTLPVPSDGGLSALGIVLISLGGALMLAGIAYSARWIIIHRGHGHAPA